MSTPHQAGFVSIIGKPNVGKSTLMNTLVGARLSIVTAKAQTTRHRICGILNGDHFQIVYTDTPGMIRPTYALHQSMMRAVSSALLDADVLLWVVDVHDKTIADVVKEQIYQRAIPTLLLINKVDLINATQLEAIRQYWATKVAVAHILPIAALQQYNTAQVLPYILTYLPVHPPYYPKDILTDQPERFFAQEIIREQILQYYHQEIPYSVEVVIDTFQEGPDLISIQAIIHIARKSQKGILIGHRGTALKRVGIAARQALEQFLGKQVFLAQKVKVTPEWCHKPPLLQKFGYGA